MHRHGFPRQDFESRNLGGFPRQDFESRNLGGFTPLETPRTVRRSLTGFTLLELLLVVAMTSAIAVAGYVTVQGTVFEDARDTGARIAVQGLRRAQRSAWYLRGDESWGVIISSTSATVFRGDDAGSRDTTFDEVLAFPGSAEVSGMTTFVFEKGSGLPVQPGTVSFSFDDVFRHVSVNAFGTVTYVP